MARDPEIIRAQKKATSKRYRERHPERVRETLRKYEATHKEARRSANRPASTREKARARSRRYRARHRDTLLAKQRASYATHREARNAATAQWREANPAMVCTYSHAYYAANAEAIRASHRRYGQLNRDVLRIRERRAYQKNPALKKATTARYHARKKGALICDLTAAQWRDIKEHYGHRCVYCGRQQQRLTQDHIIPLSKGGDHTVSNVVPACVSCNSRKGTKTPLTPVQPLLLTLSPPKKKKA